MKKNSKENSEDWKKLNDYPNVNAGIIPDYLMPDGRGLPENFDIAASTGFGLMLVKMFTEQLKGTLEVNTGAGTGFTFRFKI